MALLQVATQQRPLTPSDGSRTITITGTSSSEGAASGQSDGESSTVGALRLRGGPSRHRQHVEWGDGVVDNEGCGKKSSKICCIYHRPRRFDESSDESSSDSDSDDSCDNDHDHDHSSHSHPRRPPDGSTPSDSDRGGQLTRDGQGSVVEHERNAYEVMPSTGKGKGKKNPKV